jgi:SEC-C motif-containing protein
MSTLPVICDSCGRLFGTDRLIDAPGATVVIDGVTMGNSCPYCGGDGHVVDGTYELVGELTRLLQAPQRTVDELRRLAEILENAKERHASAEEIQARIARETPQFTSLGDLLLRARSDLYAIIQIVLTALTLVMAQATVQNISIQDVDIDVNQIIGITIEQQRQPPTLQPSTQHYPKPKVGRNDPCPCGSGKKFKRCHGFPTIEQRDTPPR